MTMVPTAAAPSGAGLLRGRRDADRRIAEWVFGLNLMGRKLSRRREREREAMRSQLSPASNEVLAIVFQRLPPKSAAACRAVCIQWHVLLSSPSVADVADGNVTSSSACFPSLDDGANAGHAGRALRRRRRGDTVPAAADGFPPLPKRQNRRSKKKQAFRRMF